MNSLTHTCTTWVSFCLKYTTCWMCRILVVGLNQFAVVYGLTCMKLKDSITGHQNTQWKTMEECFKDICNIGAGYEWAKGYSRAEFSTLDASGIIEIKAVKITGPSYKCRGPHFQHNCTHNSGNSSNKFCTKMLTWEHHKGNNYTDKFHKN